MFLQTYPFADLTGKCLPPASGAVAAGQRQTRSTKMRQAQAVRVLPGQHGAAFSVSMRHAFVALKGEGQRLDREITALS